MTEKQFTILYNMFKNSNHYLSQRTIAENCGVSIGTVNSTLSFLREQGYVCGDFEITNKGLEALLPYKVDNAIILAAGTSSRFVPFSLEKPKGLMVCKGEILIERQIRQLKEAGINNIIIVIGYMMDQFFYLVDKYNVKIIINNDYAVKNTYSSIYVARDFIRNSYICSSDNYFTENVFESHVYRAYYSSVYMEGFSDERALITNRKGRIVQTERPSRDNWVMYGHVYWNKEFSEKFLSILEQEYSREDINDWYWEWIFNEHIDSLKMYIKKYKPGIIYEFDSVQEICAFDSDYIKNSNSYIINNICNVFKCKREDITHFCKINEGLNNRSFSFSIASKKYVYRHPGNNNIDRRKEKFALEKACEIGLDDTLVYMDEQSGWKVSHFYDISEKFDYTNMEHLKRLAKLLKRLHSANIQSDWAFCPYHECKNLINKIKAMDCNDYFDIQYKTIIDRIDVLYKSLQEKPWQNCLCHNDIYETNILLGAESEKLIDWEFAGNNDIAFDICKLFALNGYTDIKIIKEILYFYFDDEISDAALEHLIICASLVYYQWFFWAIYMERQGKVMSNNLFVWYTKGNSYYDLYIRLRSEK